MTTSQELKDYEPMVEKIIFDQKELQTLKQTIKSFTDGNINAKELKSVLLQCRGRMVEDVNDFVSYVANTIAENVPELDKSNNEFSQEELPSSQVEAQLRAEIKEKNELLEIVAQRVSKLVSKLIPENIEHVNEVQKLLSKEEITKEMEHCFTRIGAKDWVAMCFLNDSEFFVKVYPKLEEVYKKRFGKSQNEQESMSYKMKKLGFPEDVEIAVINYVKARNKYQHTMTELSLSSMDLARKAFSKVFVYLLLDSMESSFLLDNREKLYANLTKFFSKQLTGNPAFRKTIINELKTVFQVD